MKGLAMQNAQYTPRRSRKMGIGAILLGLAMLSGGVAYAQGNSNGDNMNNTQSGDNNTQQNNGTNGKNTGGGGIVERDQALDEAVMSKLHYCQEQYHSCAQATKNPAGILVFPAVLKADLIVGGAGGKGALIEHGKITGYYKIGSASVGLQAGYESASQIYVFPTAESLKSLKNGSDWKVGDTEGVTVMAADANVRSSTGNIMAFIFDSNGLHAGISVDLFDIWQTGSTER